MCIVTCQPTGGLGLGFVGGSAETGSDLGLEHFDDLSAALRVLELVGELPAHMSSSAGSYDFS